jgi:hypothetical protein
MAPKTVRQLWLLGGLLAVLAVVAYLNTGPETIPTVVTRRPTAPVRYASRGRGGAAAVSDDGMVDVVRLAALHAATPAPADGGRNPFRFRSKASPPAPRAAGTQTPSAAAAAAAAAAALAPPGPPPLPPIALKFIGIVEKPSSVKIAVLSDGRNVYYGREGDTIDGRYRIERIGVESIEMTYVDGRGHQSIRLSGS